MASSPTPSPPKSGEASPRGGSPSGQAPGNYAEGLTLRALVSTREAGIVIGRGGKNVADLREQTGVKAGVSKVVPGVHERVLSVSGTVEGVAKAYGIIVAQLLASSPASPPATLPNNANPTHTSLRLLISHNLMGTIIGRAGLKIKQIQDASGVRMIASKDMLPQSTERIVDVQGTAEGIARAVEDIGRCLLEDWERGLGTVLYHPAPEHSAGAPPSTRGDSQRRGGGGSGFGGRERRSTNDSTDMPPIDARRGSVVSTNGNALAIQSSPRPNNNNNSSSNSNNNNNGDLRTQNISIPSDMVGCIIGKSGTKITEIRRLSGSKISIAKTPHDETGERMFTIVGTPEANEKALFLLYNQLESEKERRVGRGDGDEQ
ncbi:RNA binding protein, heterogenous nuclear RNP-K like protein [Tulasnella sp. 330]|nr:RNA binding protein, heterogenous nuclear RNP-K like protein [Tulasnella sp. 330]KAG8876370.1 RNA binding protein, heterogenous nuclear RNP-K like protein [Tulasnella sp. 331]KAG8884019.1 RNA binding protein, heterogenous nuclear RNP-K like protein [Tulasnella sp. 332]